MKQFLLFCLCCCLNQQGFGLDTVQTQNQFITPAHTKTTTFGTKDIAIVEGEVLTLGPFNATRVAVGDGQLVQVQLLDNGEILLIGKIAGTTSLRIWLQHKKQLSFRINITDKTQAQDIALRKMISTQVRIIEFRESSLKKIGIDWNKAATGPRFLIAQDLIQTGSSELLQGLSTNPLNAVGSTSITPLFFGANIALESTIRFMQTAGHAFSLAEPTLSCLSGESAQFLAGGEVPFSIIGADGTPSVSFKDYGIKLHIKPIADRHGRIATAIETEVSSIDHAVTVNGAPGFITRKTSTHMNVLSGQTIIISGLLTKNNAKDIDYIPGLANLPIIGKSFQSQTMSTNQSHLVIFLTPTIIDSLHHHKQQHTQPIQSTQAQHSKLKSILSTGLADIAIQFGQ